MSDALQNALAFAELNHPILPLHGTVKPASGPRWRCACANETCTSPGKHPHAGLVPHGLKDACTDPDTIARWHQAAPGINFGVVTDDLLVVDVDGAAGRASIARLEREHGALPRTWRVSTGSGGRHVYFAPPPGVEIRNSASKIAKGIDVRAGGGYVVIPGSRHVTGHLYAWFRDWHPSEHDMAPCPDWLRALVAEPKGARPDAYYKEVVSRPIVDGERHTRFLEVMGHFIAKDVDPRILNEVAQSWNRDRFVPPLDAEEAADMIGNLYMLERAKWGGL